MENIETIIENQQLPSGKEYILSPDGITVSLPKSELIELIKLILPDLAFMGVDSNLYIKYNTILKELENED